MRFEDQDHRYKTQTSCSMHLKCHVNRQLDRQLTFNNQIVSAFAFTWRGELLLAGRTAPFRNQQDFHAKLWNQIERAAEHVIESEM